MRDPRHHILEALDTEIGSTIRLVGPIPRIGEHIRMNSYTYRVVTDVEYRYGDDGQFQFIIVKVKA